MAGRFFARTVTTLLVVAVLVLAGWFAFSALTGATLITFRTGSMSPTMPQGAVAVSLPVTAAEIVVGDVVTVRRDAQELPVTHRVVEVRAADQAQTEGIPADARELILKGDDNENVDLEPYIVKDARRVLFAVPGVGAALMVVQSPVGMGTLTILAGFLAAWAFWPRRADEDDALDSSDAEASDIAVSDDDAVPTTRRARREAGITA